MHGSATRINVRKETVSFYNFTNEIGPIEKDWNGKQERPRDGKKERTMSGISTAIHGDLFICLDMLFAWPMHTEIYAHLLSNFNQNRIDCNFLVEK